MVTAIIVAAMLQSAAINAKRDSYMACLDKGIAEAKVQKAAADGLGPVLKSNCASAADGLMAALVAFDVKNKVPKKQATDDAQTQIDELMNGTVETYKSHAPK